MTHIHLRYLTSGWDKFTFVFLSKKQLLTHAGISQLARNKQDIRGIKSLYRLRPEFQLMYQNVADTDFQQDDN